MCIERQPVLPQDIQCPDAIRHIHQHELASVHKNPAVVEAIALSVGRITAKHVLKPENQTNPIHIKPWKIFPDGTCHRCHNERNIRLK